MSKMTSFKRIALAVVVSLGFGVLSTGPSNSALVSETLTIDAATDTVTTLDTATAVLTHVFQASVAKDSATIQYSCSAPTGFTCPVPTFYVTPTSDTSNVYAFGGNERGTDETATSFYQATKWTDSAVATTSPSRAVVNVKAENIPAAGTYTYSFYTTNDISGTYPRTTPVVTWTVTASGADRATASARIYISSDPYTAYTKRISGSSAAASDSAIVTDKGTAATPAIVGYAYVSPRNAAGDTSVVVGTTRFTVDESVTVSVSGPGYVSAHKTAPTTSGNYGKAVTLDSRNGSTLVNASPGESLTILSDGTAGTMTMTFTGRSGVALGTKTVTFTGGVASVSQAYFATRKLLFHILVHGHLRMIQ